MDATAADKTLLQQTLDGIAECFVEGIVYAMRRVPPVNYGGELESVRCRSGSWCNEI